MKEMSFAPNTQLESVIQNVPGVFVLANVWVLAFGGDDKQFIATYPSLYNRKDFL